MEDHTDSKVKDVACKITKEALKPENRADPTISREIPKDIKKTEPQGLSAIDSPPAAVRKEPLKEPFCNEMRAFLIESIGRSPEASKAAFKELFQNSVKGHVSNDGRGGQILLKWDQDKLNLLHTLGNQPEGLEILYALTPFFDGKHWQTLRTSPIIFFVDFSRLFPSTMSEERRKAMFANIFPIGDLDLILSDGGTDRLDRTEWRNRDRFSEFVYKNPKSFYSAIGDLNYAHWNYLMRINFTLDLSKISPEMQKKLAQSVPFKMIPTPEMDEHTIKQIRNIREGLETKYKKEEVIPAAKQYLEIIKSLDPKEQKRALDYLLAKDSGESIYTSYWLEDLGNEEEGLEILYKLSSSFSEKHWKRLSDEQVIAADFSKLLPSKEENKVGYEQIVTWLFPVSFTEKVSDETKQRIIAIFEQDREKFYALQYYLLPAKVLDSKQVLELDVSRLTKEVLMVKEVSAYLATHIPDFDQ